MNSIVCLRKKFNCFIRTVGIKSINFFKNLLSEFGGATWPPMLLHSWEDSQPTSCQGPQIFQPECHCTYEFQRLGLHFFRGELWSWVVYMAEAIGYGCDFCGFWQSMGLRRGWLPAATRRRLQHFQAETSVPRSFIGLVSLQKLVMKQ